MTALKGARGALLDVDGTLLEGDAPIPGAAAALERLRSQRIPFRLTTNTTRCSRAEIASALGRVGIQVETDEVVIPASLARRRIVASSDPTACLLIPDASKIDFKDVVEVREGERPAEAPGWVVVGDLGPGFTFGRLNEAFSWLRAGSRMLALHRNRFWHNGDAMVLDAGPFVAALEFATGLEAEVVGKPSRSFFELALDDLGLAAGEVVCIGDNLENDCVGAARAGCRTLMVRTGLFDQKAVNASAVQPEDIVDSIDDILRDGNRSLT